MMTLVKKMLLLGMISQSICDVDEKNIDVDTSRNPPLVRCEAVIGQAALRMNYTPLSFYLLNKKSTYITLTELYQ